MFKPSIQGPPRHPVADTSYNAPVHPDLPVNEGELNDFYELPHVIQEFKDPFFNAELHDDDTWYSDT
jgi:hypothetical protein